jgi:hypothetical protein
MAINSGAEAVPPNPWKAFELNQIPVDKRAHSVAGDWFAMFTALFLTTNPIKYTITRTVMSLAGFNGKPRPSFAFKAFDAHGVSQGSHRPIPSRQFRPDLFLIELNRQ